MQYIIYQYGEDGVLNVVDAANTAEEAAGLCDKHEAAWLASGRDYGACWFRDRWSGRQGDRDGICEDKDGPLCDGTQGGSVLTGREL